VLKVTDLAALWHRKYIPPMNPIYLDAFVSKIICAWSPYSKDKPFDIEHKYSVSEPI